LSTRIGRPCQGFSSSSHCCQSHFTRRALLWNWILVILIPTKHHLDQNKASCNIHRLLHRLVQDGLIVNQIEPWIWKGHAKVGARGCFHRVVNLSHSTATRTIRWNLTQRMLIG
jgi:hypothetical protein